MTSTIESVTAVVQDALESSGIDVDLDADTSLLESGMLDSMSIVFVVQGLQDQFDIDIDFADITIERFDTVASISEFVDSAVA